MQNRDEWCGIGAEETAGSAVNESMEKPLNNENVLGTVVAGGRGERLFPLTNARAEPAVPCGGKYRIIDFVLSNFVNSGIHRIYVLTQFKSQSLSDHLEAGWCLSDFLQDRFVKTILAQMHTGDAWYSGTADAVFQNVHLVERDKPDLLRAAGEKAAFHGRRIWPTA